MSGVADPLPSEGGRGREQLKSVFAETHGHVHPTFKNTKHLLYIKCHFLFLILSRISPRSFWRVFMDNHITVCVNLVINE